MLWLAQEASFPPHFLPGGTICQQFVPLLTVYAFAFVLLPAFLGALSLLFFSFSDGHAPTPNERMFGSIRWALYGPLEGFQHISKDRTPIFSIHFPNLQGSSPKLSSITSRGPSMSSNQSNFR